MKFVLLLARGLAEAEGSPEVEVTHFRRAIAHLATLPNEKASRLYNYLGIPHPTTLPEEQDVLAIAEQALSALDLPLSEGLQVELENFRGDYVFYQVPAIFYGDDRFCNYLPPMLPAGDLTSSPLYSQLPEDGSPTRTELEKILEWERQVRSREKTRTRTQTQPPTPNAPAVGSDEPAARAVLDAHSLSVMKDLSSRIQAALVRGLHGQQAVIDAIDEALFRQTLVEKQNGPLATFFMVGPPGSGKTFAASLLAAATGWPTKTIEMSSMPSPNQAFALTGMSKGYTDALPGELTDFVRLNPRSVVVLENLDHAHPNNQGVLLPMFDGGFLRDQFGFYPSNDFNKPSIAPPDVDFRNAIIIITTNAASQELLQPSLMQYLDEAPKQASRAIYDALARERRSFRDGELPSFSHALLSRLSAECLLFFKPLRLEALIQIAADNCRRFEARLRAVFDTAVTLKPEAAILRAATLSLGPDLDARLLSNSTLTDAIFAKAVRALKDADPKKRPKSISIEADRKFLDELDLKLLELEGREPVRELRRKQWALGFEIVQSLSRSGKLESRFADPEWKITRRARDFNRPGSLQVELPDVRFADIAGHERVKLRLQEVVRLLKSPQVLKNWDLASPKGMLLYGPPGTGKTMLAKALAREAMLPFMAASGPELLRQGFIAELFARARHYAPAILFLDEIDALGVRGRPDSYPVLINQLLTEIDGFASEDGAVFVVVASNFQTNIDPAILRPGRIDLHVEVPALDPPAREFFLKRIQKFPGGEKLDLTSLVRYSSGMSGAQLEMVRREIGIGLIRTGRRELAQAEVVEMINEVKYGERRGEASAKSRLEHVAVHEAGHAVASLVLNPELPIEQVSIVARSRAAGFVSFDADAPTRPYTRREVIEFMAVALAGRTAQRRKFGDEGVDDGASDDLAKATRMACLAIGAWGLDSEVGNRSVAALQERGLPYVEVDRLDAWIWEAGELAEQIIEHHIDVVSDLASCLIERETISGDELRGLCTNRLSFLTVADICSMDAGKK